MAKKEHSNFSKEDEGGTYHIPVLLHECLEALAIKSEGTYVDATFGGGGHSKAILERLGEHGKLFVFDQDTDALKNVPDDERLVFIHANFRGIKRFLRLHEAIQGDGILADLCVSSWQFDTAERGFSYRFDGPLDMRMNRGVGKTAAEVLNEYDAETLQQMFSDYGEVRNSKTLAGAIVEARGRQKFETIADLKTLAEQNARGGMMKYLSQVFQAVRMEVNDEFGSLKDLLEQCAEVLKPGGRLAVITFHSLEDRLVKNYMKHSSFEDGPEKDFFGNYELEFKVISKKPITAGVEELKRNPRSRSAKLRVAEKV
jgi:16S rRNA (cytosine1402-N4)-methyltransferase